MKRNRYSAEYLHGMCEACSCENACACECHLGDESIINDAEAGDSDQGGMGIDCGQLRKIYC